MIWFPFSEFRDLDTLQRFIECVTAVFTQHSFQVNAGKLEVCAVVAGPGTQSRVAQLKRVLVGPQGIGEASWLYLARRSQQQG